MCYGSCRWEGYMGDCNFPKHIPEVNKYYPNLLCDLYMAGADKYELAYHEKECSHVRELVNNHYINMKRLKKIKKIKSRFV